MNECKSKQWCKLRGCEDKATSMYINGTNCTCRGCLERSENKECEDSGDPYNTDFDCMMEK